MKKSTIEELEEELIRSPLNPRPNFPEERDVAIILSDGTYAKLAALAAQWSLPMTAVQQRAHQIKSAMKPGRKRKRASMPGVF